MLGRCDGPQSRAVLVAGTQAAVPSGRLVMARYCRTEDYASIAREYTARIQSLGVCQEMDFSAVALTETQQAFAEEVRAFLDEQLTPEVVARDA